MVSKLYDGSNWKNLNGLKLYNGSAWKNAVRGWMWNGSSWKQWYPEYPINTVAPTVSGSTTQGQTLSSTTGTWNTNNAYVGSYTYQWTRAGSNISGATSSTYTTAVADVGNAIACKVTSTNNRGATTITSSNSITIVAATPGPPSNLSLTNGTSVPGQPGSATTTYTGGITATFTFTTASGTFQDYEVLTSDSRDIVNPKNPTSPQQVIITKGQDTGPRTLYVGVIARNNQTYISMSWTAGTNATSYDIYIGGSFVANTPSTSYSYYVGTVNWPSTASRTINVRSRNASGAETTGVTGTINVGGTASAVTPGQVNNITW